MKLVQIFLPLYDNHGNALPKALFDQVRENFTAQFGGVTAFVRSPALGLWENDAGNVCRDDVVLFEVMTDALDRQWWVQTRRELECRFAQESILIRVTEVEML